MSNPILNANPYPTSSPSGAPKLSNTTGKDNINNISGFIKKCKSNFIVSWILDCFMKPIKIIQELYKNWRLKNKINKIYNNMISAFEKGDQEKVKQWWNKIHLKLNECGEEKSIELRKKLEFIISNKQGNQLLSMVFDKEVTLLSTITDADIDAFNALVYSKNVNINAPDASGYRPLTYALELKNPDCARMVPALLNHKNIDTNYTVNLGVLDTTVFGLAVMQDNVEAVKIMLKLKNVNFTLHDLGIFSIGILSLAVISQNAEMVEILLQYKDFDFLGKDKTAIYNAALFGSLDIVKLLLKYDSENEFLKSQGTAFLWNVIRLIDCNDDRHLNIANFLLTQKGVDINFEDEIEGTPLMYAASAGYLDMVNCLLAQEDIKVDLIGKGFWVRGKTALMKAFEKGHKEIVTVLLARSNIRVELLCAIEKNNLKLVNYLLGQTVVEIKGGKDYDYIISTAEYKMNNAIVAALKEKKRNLESEKVV